MPNSQDNFFSWSRKRQIVIAVIVIGFLFLLGWFVDFLFFNIKPTCFDGKQNGNETGIDCGGQCALVCSSQTKDPIVEFARLFKSLRGFSAVARVENPNDLISQKAEYSFKLYDQNGEMIAERTGTTFIPRQKTFAVFEPNIETGNLEPAKVLFSFKPIMWEKSDYNEPFLDIQDEKLSGEKTNPKLSANVLNTTVREVNGAELISILYDDAGNAINASKTVIPKILPNEKFGVTYTWPYPLPETIHVCAQPVDVAVIIDRSGSMEFLGKDPPQPLTDVKNAADYFVKQLNDKNQVSIISFANEATIDTPLTENLNSAVSTINEITIHDRKIQEQNTNIASGLGKAFEELSSSRHNQASVTAAILLTDGVADLPLKKDDPGYPENAANAIGQKIKQNSITLFTIGLGKDVNKQFLTNLASAPENAFLAPSTGELTSIYQTIGIKICKRGTSRIEILPLVPDTSSE